LSETKRFFICVVSNKIHTGGPDLSRPTVIALIGKTG